MECVRRASATTVYFPGFESAITDFEIGSFC